MLPDGPAARSQPPCRRLLLRQGRQRLAVPRLDALLRASRREGVDIRYGTRVESLEQNGSGFRVRTRAGTIAAGKVLLCTDWAVPDLVAPLGIDIPVVPLPKEILVTAPAPQMVKPILVSLEHRIAVNQVGPGQ